VRRLEGEKKVGAVVQDVAGAGRMGVVRSIRVAAEDDERVESREGKETTGYERQGRIDQYRARNEMVRVSTLSRLVRGRIEERRAVVVVVFSSEKRRASVRFSLPSSPSKAHWQEMRY
jgi:hypothetical protein